MISHLLIPSSFFFNDTATTEIYTLSLHDALPIWMYDELRPNTGDRVVYVSVIGQTLGMRNYVEGRRPDRKSTRLNSSHANISYAVFCLKKKKLLNIAFTIV